MVSGGAGIRTWGTSQCTALQLRHLGPQNAEYSSSWSGLRYLTSCRTLHFVLLSSSGKDSGQEWGEHSHGSQRRRSPVTAGLQLPPRSARPSPYPRRLFNYWRLLERNETAPWPPASSYTCRPRPPIAKDSFLLLIPTSCPSVFSSSINTLVSCI